ncbi:MAG: glycerophosphodiester phosphodiesterase family protein [Faecalimonas sp.]|nr:glycerophosphodiester phosphodiesterase family protein [Faecalimonas sp.]
MEILYIVVGIVLVLLVLGLWMICPRIFGKPNREPFLGVYYAHRGLFANDSEAPENSLLAIQKAVEAGYGIEFDVQLTKDEVPVVFHDASLKRMCGVDGKIWEYTLSELRQMKLLGSRQTIPTLTEVLKAVDGKVPLIIEYKMDRVDTRVCELGNAILETYKGVYCMESFHPFAVRWYRKFRPDVMRGQLSMNHAREGKTAFTYKLVSNLLTNFLARPDFIAYCHEDADRFALKLCRRLGALAVAWTIRSQAQYENVKTQFDLFIFDSFRLGQNEKGE